MDAGTAWRLRCKNTNLSFSYHMYSFISLQRSPGCLERKETSAWFDQAQGNVPGPPPVAQTEQEAGPISAALSMPQVAPKPTQPRVGQRAPERDPIGETNVLSARKASGCSFTEVIEVTPAQIEKAGVSRFECPTCLAVRDIYPKGGRVKFPWHPKRTTNTPNQGLRWVKREITWGLSE
jgi:hypothetical protein